MNFSQIVLSVFPEKPLLELPLYFGYAKGVVYYKVTFGSAQAAYALFVMQSVLAKHPQASQMDWPKEVVYYKVTFGSAQAAYALLIMQSVLAKHPPASQMDWPKEVVYYKVAVGSASGHRHSFCHAERLSEASTGQPDGCVTDPKNKSFRMVFALSGYSKSRNL